MVQPPREIAGPRGEPVGGVCYLVRGERLLYGRVKRGEWQVVTNGRKRIERLRVPDLELSGVQLLAEPLPSLRKAEHVLDRARLPLDQCEEEAPLRTREGPILRVRRQRDVPAAHSCGQTQHVGGGPAIVLNEVGGPLRMFEEERANVC